MRHSMTLALSLVLLTAATNASAAPPSSSSRGDASDTAVAKSLSRVRSTVELGPVAQPASPVPATTGALLEGGKRDGLARIANVHAEARMHAASAKDAVAAPRMDATTSRPMAGVRAHERMDARRVLASMEDGFRGCASKGAPASVTRYELKLSISPEGAVESVEVDTSTPTRGAVDACLSAVAASGKFRPPGGPGARLSVPIALSASHAGRSDGRAPARETSTTTVQIIVSAEADAEGGAASTAAPSAKGAASSDRAQTVATRNAI